MFEFPGDSNHVIVVMLVEKVSKNSRIGNLKWLHNTISIKPISVIWMETFVDRNLKYHETISVVSNNKFPMYLKYFS